jgi:hypothetical protein
MRRITLAFTCFAIGLLNGACGSDDDGQGQSGAGAPVSQTEAYSLCQSYQAHATECGWQDVPNFDWNCSEAAMVWRADAFRAFESCVEDLRCDGDGQSCLASTRNALGPTPAQEAYAARCRARETECGASAVVIDTLCDKSARVLYSDSYVNQFTAGFDRACDQILQCFESAG